MFHRSLFKLLYLPTQLDLILTFCYKARNWKSLGRNTGIQDGWFFPSCFQFYRILGWNFQWSKVMGDVSCVSARQASISFHVLSASLFTHVLTHTHPPPTPYNRQKKLGQVLYEFISKKLKMGWSKEQRVSLLFCSLPGYHWVLVFNLVGDS